MSVKTKLADARYSRVAKKQGMSGSLRLLWEARAAGVSPSLALALRTQESGIRGDGNVFGHDPTIFAGGKVTKARYLAYKKQRGATGKGGMQGVGPLQLTYYTFQDEADRLGGCWKPKLNYRVGYRDLAHQIRMHGKREALAIYNGGAANPNFRYADSVLDHERFWHARLT